MTTLQLLNKNTIRIMLFWAGIFYAGVSMGNNTFINSIKISNIEIFLISAYVLSIPPDSKPLKWISMHKLVSALLLILLIVSIYSVYYYRPVYMLAVFAMVYAAFFLSQQLVTEFKAGHISVLLTENKHFFLLIFLWVSSVGVSYVLAQQALPSGFGLNRYVQTLMHVLFFLMVWRYFQQINDKTIALILSAIPAAAVVVVIGTFIIYLMHQPEGIIAPWAWFHDPPFNGHIRHAGFPIATALAVGLSLLAVVKKTRFWIGCLLISSSLSWAYLFWAGGRAGIGAVMIITIVIGYIIYRNNLDIRRYCLYAVSTLVIGLVLSELAHVFLWNGLFQGIRRTIEYKHPAGIASGRVEAWVYSMKAVEEHPFFGLGPNGYLSIPERVKMTSQPHNLFVQFLVEWGVVGTLLFAAIIFSSISRGWTLLLNTLQYPRNSTSLLIAWSTIVTLTIYGLTDGTYFVAQSCFYLTIAYAVLWAINSRIIHLNNMTSINLGFRRY